MNWLVELPGPKNFDTVTAPHWDVQDGALMFFRANETHPFIAYAQGNWRSIFEVDS